MAELRDGSVWVSEDGPEIMRSLGIDEHVLDSPPENLNGQFKYDALPKTSPHIRLLKIHLPLNGLINLSLHEFKLDKDAPYRAVSYTWGPELPLYEIYVNNKIVYVRENLFQFLRDNCLSQSYHHPLAAYLWIDALCIDQSSIDERNQQVSLMHEIFRNALETFVWLGPESEDSKLALPHISAWQHFSSHQQPAMDDKVVQPPTPSSPIIEALHDLFQRPYWRRLWIIQELMYSSRTRICCGTDRTNWSALRNFLLSSYDTGDGWRKVWSIRYPTEPVPSYIMSLIEQEDERFAASNSASKLGELRQTVLLEKYNYAECSEPRDKIFGL